MVEGVEGGIAAGTTWWGGGLARVAAHPITLAYLISSSTPRTTIRPASSPDVVRRSRLPGQLPTLWDHNWGFIAEQGIAPVLLGGLLPTRHPLLAWLDTLVGYLGARRRLLVVQPEQR